MPSRVAPIRNSVSITFNRKSFAAERGEPVAASLVAAGYVALARSPKFHRPRGPWCMRGGCDGCLARVDGVPNVMTCAIPARDQMVIESQNSLGTRTTDLLRATDWFFPQGVNHHELFAGVPGLRSAMQAFAERITGLGRIPSVVAQPKAACRRTADVLVIGAGPSGMAAALACAKRGRSVEVIDMSLQRGGGARAVVGRASDEWSPLLSEFDDAVSKGGVKLRLQTVVAGIFHGELLVVGGEATEIVRPKTTVLACGAHDALPAFENNDIPGIFSARAAGWLFSNGVSIGDSVVVACSPGEGLFGVAYAEALKASGHESVRLVHGDVVSASGSSHVKQVTVRKVGGEELTIKADALVVDAPRSPSYELSVQAGVDVGFENGRFRVPAGSPSKGIWGVGEMVGTKLSRVDMQAEAARVAEASLVDQSSE